MTRFKSLASLFLTTSLMLTPMAALANESYENTIQVSGQGRVKTLPDSISINFNVDTTAKTMLEAREQNAKKMSGIVTKLKALGLPGLEVETDYFNANPTYKYDKNGRSSITGYQVNHSMTARVEHITGKEKLEDAAAKLTDTTINAGSTSTGSVSFYLSDNNPVFDEAMTLAVKQARHKADVIAAAAGTKITGVYLIESYSNSTPMAVANGMMLKTAPGREGDAYAEPPSPITAGKLNVEASATIRFDIAD